MFSKNCNFPKIVLSLFLFFISTQIVNAQCNPDHIDTDNDGICDIEDMDDDNDGILDDDEFTIQVLIPENTNPNYINNGNHSNLNNPEFSSSTSWSAPSLSNNYYVGITLDEPSKLVSVSTKGRGNYDQWLTSFDLEATKDGSNWQTIGTYTGNSDRNTIAKNNIANTDKDWVGLRIRPQTWYGHPSLRFEFEIGLADGDFDGISNSIDLDSDNDLCSDSFEGSAGLNINQIDNNTGAILGAVNTTIGSATYGVPLIIGQGQNAGTAYQSSNLPANKECLCIYQINSIDTDADGICDIADRCINFDDNLIGQACNDYDPCTINDVYVDCECKGTKLPDSDNDQICDAVDLCANFDDELDIDDDGIPYCLDNCIDVDEDNICDDIDSNILIDKLKLYVSKRRGYYNTAFEVEIICNDPNATIRYSLTNALPTQNSGSIYNIPISINSSEVLKIVATNGTKTTELVTYSYIFLPDVANIEINNHIKNNPSWLALIDSAFYSLPVVSVSGENDNFIDNTNGTKYNVSVEYFDHNDEDAFHINAGINSFGNHSLRTYAKKNHRLRFDTIYGDKNLKFDLFDGFEEGVEPVKKFDKLDLRSSHDSWFFTNEGMPCYFSTKLVDDFMKAGGNINPHVKHVHVFFNGAYRGMYTLRERFDDNMLGEYEKIDNFNYDFINGSDSYDTWGAGVLVDGNGTFWSNLVSNSNNYLVWKEMANESNLFTAMVLDFNFTFENEWNGAGSQNSNLGFHFNINDADLMFTRDNRPGLDAINLTNCNGPNSMFRNLYVQGDPNFFQNFADEVHCMYKEENSIFNYDNFINRIDLLADQIRLAMITESGKWGGVGKDPNVWEVEINRIKSTFYASKIELKFDQIRNLDLYPNLEAVKINLKSGIYSDSTEITLQNPNNTGNIYYTTNGEDVKMQDGSVNPNAILYQNRITLTTGVTSLVARVNDPNTNPIHQWSAFCEPIVYYVNQNYSNVVLNEIHYNPNDSIYYNNTLAVNDTVDGKNFEFIELKNIGNEPVNLLNCSFSKGVELVFEESIIIEPDSFRVFAEDVFWFKQKYGFAPDGKFSGKLDNGGEKINLKNPKGYFIDTLRYDNGGVWDAIPDEGEYSLAYIVNSPDNNDPANWAAQKVFVTPRAENEFCVPINNNSTVAEISCYGANDGFISTQLSGGTAPFSYSWSNGAETSTISNLSPGNYNVTITDNYNCPYTESFTINEPVQLSGNITSNNQRYYQTNDGSASVTNVVGGVPPYSYNWSNGATTTVVNNLAPGNYSVDVIDANGCLFNKNLVINSIFCNTMVADVTIDNETCIGANDGLLILKNISNGTAPYSILWSTGITGTVTNNLTSANYQLTITDIYGCPYQNNYTVEADNIIQASFNIYNVSSATLNDGSIAASPSGGTAPYNYNWSNGTSNQNLSNVGEGLYSITITDANGCSEFFDQLVIGNDCIASIVQQNNSVILSQIYQVSDFIQSNGIVNINKQVCFKAGDYIELVDEFEVIQGAEFEAKIDGCE